MKTKIKNLILSISVVFMSTTGFSANPFKIVIKTDNSGVSTSTQFKLPLVSGYVYNFVVKWGDGKIDTITAYNQSKITHTYPIAGCYPIEISDTCQYFCFNNGGDKLKLLDIRQWGNVNTTNVVNSYLNCTNLIGTFEDTLNLSGLTNHSLEGVFQGCAIFNGHVEWFNVSTVTNMHNFLYGCKIFNRQIGIWGHQTSNVTNMSAMLGITMFDGQLDSLDTHNVTNFYAMFYGNPFFNHTLDSLNVSNATDMSYMLAYARDYNQPITTWNTKRNKTFEQFLIGYPVSYGAPLNNEFNQSIDSLDFDSVTTIKDMLHTNVYFNQPVNITIPVVTNAVNFLTQSYGLSVANCDSLLINLIGWNGSIATKNVQSNVTMRVDAQYTKAPSYAADSYAYLKYTKGWTFLGLTPTP